MAVSSTHPVVHELCQAFGFDTDKTRKIVLTMEAGELVTLDVEMYPAEKELFLSGEIINKRFHLVEVTD